MKSIRDISALFRSEERVLGKEQCDCGEVVELVETIVPIGPKKGEKLTYKRGCKCEEKRIANEVRTRHEALKLDRLNRLFSEESLINASLQSAEFTNYTPRTELQDSAWRELAHFARDFEQNNPTTYILTGPFGVGKSHLAYATCEYVLAKGKERIAEGGDGYTVLFLSVPKLLTKIQSTYNKESDVSEDDMLNYIATVDLLVLDDIGAEYKSASKWTQSKLFEIVDSRVGRSTIYTTNLSVDEFDDPIIGLGSRISSRMQDNAYVLKMDGEDLRKSSVQIGGKYF